MHHCNYRRKKKNIEMSMDQQKLKINKHTHTHTSLCISSEDKSELTVSKKRNTRELVNPPSIVNSSDEASFPLYISWRERVTTKRRREYNIEFPDSAIGFKALKQKQKQVPLELNGQN